MASTISTLKLDVESEKLGHFVFQSQWPYMNNGGILNNPSQDTEDIKVLNSENSV